MIKHLSASSYGMYLRCGHQFYMRYIMDIISPPNIAMITGSSSHKGAEHTNKTLKETEALPPLDEVQDITRDAFVANTLERGVWLLDEEKSEKDKLLNEGMNQSIDLASSYQETYAPNLKNITFTEELLSADIGLDLPIVGIPDFITDNVNVDIKISAKKWAEGKEHTSQQPTFYRILAEQNNLVDKEKFKSAFVILTQYKIAPKTMPAYWDGERKVAIDYRETVRTDEDIECLKKRLSMMIKAINSGVFPPADPDHWICSRDRCGYHSQCPYVKGV